MNLSVSNIAWSAEYDEEMYDFLNNNGINGLEIAPTCIFQYHPYDNLVQAKDFACRLKEDYGIVISSIQSIWFGITESIFDSDSCRQRLVDYTKKAIDFACMLGCSNIVFGCPQNRTVPSDITPNQYLPIAYDFFNQIGDYASACRTYIAIEPNPAIYNTNFINTTPEAFEICHELNNPGIKINADIGTLIHNNENIEILIDNINLINHIHISEPYLVPIKKRILHNELKNKLQGTNYDKFLSVEMSNNNNIELVKTALLYIKELYGDI